MARLSSKKRPTAVLRPTRIIKSKSKSVPQHGRLTRLTSEATKHKFLELIDGPKEFSAFKVQEKYDARNGRVYQKSVVKSPETGIHSKTWAQSIKVQPGFTSLATEVRHRIYHLVFAHSESNQVSPRYVPAHGKFINSAPHKVHLRAGSLFLINAYLSLSLVCRQTYVDVVGSGLFYQRANFYFVNRPRFSKYVSSINPYHVSCIKSLVLNLDFHVDAADATLWKTVAVLGRMELLECLDLGIYSDRGPDEKDKVLEEEDNWAPLAKKLKGCWVAFCYHEDFCTDIVDTEAIEDRMKAIEDKIQAMLIK